MNELDLMSTKDILIYLGRNRFDGMVCAGVPRSNSQQTANVNCMIKGSKENIELIQMDMNTQVTQFLTKPEE